MHIPQSYFQKHLLAANPGFASLFNRWEFLPGMLFGSRQKWWDRTGLRARPHEGLDLCFFADRKGGYRWLETDISIPALYDGQLLSVCKDFIGRSLFVESHLENDLRVIWAFGHMRPADGLDAGVTISAGQPLGRLAMTGSVQSRVRPHLHISLALPDNRWSPSGIAWSAMVDPVCCELLDPLVCMGM